jgi:hypothetical protein
MKTIYTGSKTYHIQKKLVAFGKKRINQKSVTADKNKDLLLVN